MAILGLCEGVRLGGVGEWEGDGLTREDTCLDLDGFSGGFSAAALSSSLNCSATSTCSLPITVA